MSARTREKLKTPVAESTSVKDSASSLPGWLAGCAGFILGLSLIKFGNPVVLDVPEDSWDFWKLLFFSWPVQWGLILSTGFLVLALSLHTRWKFHLRDPLFILPVLWLFWQVFSAFQSDDSVLSWRTVPHFAVCLAWFYLGYLVLSRSTSLKPVWIGLLCGNLVVILFSLEQRYHGIHETRVYFYQQLDWGQYSPEFLQQLTSRPIPDSVIEQVRNAPQVQIPNVFLSMIAENPLPLDVQQRLARDHGMAPDFMKKINSGRIWGTLVYPNTLAGVLLLMTPILGTFIWRNATAFTFSARILLIFGYTGVSLACLFWSGSKSGWLIALTMGFAAFLRIRIDRRIRLVLAGLVVVAGLGGFFYRYGDFFQKGATSVSARFGYWESALHTARHHPILGAGPGTFSRTYSAYKKPDWEMARLAHNDYLEQASDSGWPGFFLFTGFFTVAFYRLLMTGMVYQDPLLFSILLSLCGWAIQGLVEFGLYIPALAWPAYFIFGWISGRVLSYRQSSAMAGQET